MAIKIYTFDADFNIQLNNEGTIRSTNDTNIQGAINVEKTKVGNTSTTVAGLNQAISNESSARATAGGPMDFGGLTHDVDGSQVAVETITQAINALNAESLVNETAVGNTGGSDLTDAATNVSDTKAILDVEVPRIAAMLDLSTETEDSFKELLDLINANDSTINDFLTTLNTDIQAIITTKAKKIQDDTTDVYYVDSTTDTESANFGKQYKIVFVDGNITLEEIA
jgi:hypothetical protein